MNDFRELLAALRDAQVEYILVGGMAAVAHGSARLTEDIDIVYRRTPENIEKTVKALSQLRPYLRGAPPGLPFRFDVRTIERGLNFTLTTSAGDIDLLGEITGGGGYQELLPHSVPLTVYGAKILCLGLDRLIHVKRAAGRPKDLEAIAELEDLRDEMASGDKG
jgi:predicted nucleotidyltransferase